MEIKKVEEAIYEARRFIPKAEKALELLKKKNIVL